MNINKMFTYEKFKKMYLERLKKPTTIWSIIVFIFSLGGVYTTMNNRISRLEEFTANVDVVKINTTLAQIQADIERIKLNINK